MSNPNSQLDPQEESYSFAVMTSEELADYDLWLAEVEEKERNCQH